MNEKNLWPMGILAIVLTVIGLIVWTIRTAASSPTEGDRMYFMDYHDVDKHYNELEAMRVEFNRHYDVVQTNEKLDIGENVLSLKVTNKEGQPIENAAIKALMSRPHTNQDDIKLGDMHYENGTYRSESFTIPKQGRWQSNYLITIGPLKTYRAIDINTSRIR